MSSYSYNAMNCFKENLNLFAPPTTEPEKFNLYNGLLNLANAIRELENDIDEVKQDIKRIKGAL